MKINLLNKKREVTLSEYDRLKESHWVITPINLLCISDNALIKVLMFMNHLDNHNTNTSSTKEIKITQSLIAKATQTPLDSVKKQLKKLKEVGFIDWGKTHGEENRYAFNRDMFDWLVVTINSMELDERIEFLSDFFNTKPIKSTNTHKHQKQAKIKQEKPNLDLPVEDTETDIIPEVSLQLSNTELKENTVLNETPTTNVTNTVNIDSVEVERRLKHIGEWLDKIPTINKENKLTIAQQLMVNYDEWNKEFIGYNKVGIDEMFDNLIKCNKGIYTKETHYVYYVSTAKWCNKFKTNDIYKILIPLLPKITNQNFIDDIKAEREKILKNNSI